MDPAQRTATYSKGRRLLRTFRDDVRAHLSKRLDHAIHRPTTKRRITDQSTLKSLTRKQTGKQTHGRTGAATIDFAARRCENAFFAVDDNNVRFRVFDLNAERAQCAHCV